MAPVWAMCRPDNVSTDAICDSNEIDRKMESNLKRLDCGFDGLYWIHHTTSNSEQINYVMPTTKTREHGWRWWKFGLQNGTKARWQRKISKVAACNSINDSWEKNGEHETKRHMHWNGWNGQPMGFCIFSVHKKWIQFAECSAVSMSKNWSWKIANLSKISSLSGLTEISDFLFVDWPNFLSSRIHCKLHSHKCRFNAIACWLRKPSGKWIHSSWYLNLEFPRFSLSPSIFTLAREHCIWVSGRRNGFFIIHFSFSACHVVADFFSSVRVGSS